MHLSFNGLRHHFEGELTDELDTNHQAYEALVLGTRDYVLKNGFRGGIVGLSGGIDSALTLAIAADALGPDQVTAVIMPSRYTAAMSVEDARACAQALGVQAHEISIESAYTAFEQGLAPAFKTLPPTLPKKICSLVFEAPTLWPCPIKRAGLFSLQAINRSLLWATARFMGIWRVATL